MITAAHVGVGIQGLEGKQASRSADYAIGQFQYLRTLMFYHGREAYRRNAFLVIYMFYKNITFVMPQYWFGFVSAFSGQTLYESWIYQLYNIVFTAFPVMWYSVMDKQFSKKILQNNPSHYQIGLKDDCFNFYQFWIKGVFIGMMDALVITLAVYGGLDGIRIDYENGYPGCFWYSGTAVYALVVIVVNLYIVKRSHVHTYFSTALISLSIISFFVVLYLENLFPMFEPVYRIFPYILGNWKFYVVTAVSVWYCWAQDLVFETIENKLHERAKSKKDAELKTKLID
jgi:phospholipid-transporting ATPase